VFLLQLKDGSTKRIDPSIDSELFSLDDRSFQKQIRRVAILDENGKRVDLPLNKNGAFVMWLERVEKGGVQKGERFCMRNGRILLRATLYYSDSRVVFDLDKSGGFR
jgi:hypothetical protein